MDEVTRDTERSNTEKKKKDKEVKKKSCQKDLGVTSETESLASSECKRIRTQSGSYWNQSCCRKRGKSYHYGERGKKLYARNGTRNGLGTVTGSGPRHKRAGQEHFPHMCSGSSTFSFCYALFLALSLFVYRVKEW